MIQELIYTSVPRGLTPGSKGFCVVASTRNLPPHLSRFLESLSGYRPVPGQANQPIAWSYLEAEFAGQRYRILSRVCDYGLDYSQRTNKLAHHAAVTDERLPQAGPAWVLSQKGYLKSNWDGEPRLISQRPLPTGTQEPGICSTWTQVAGDAGWAGVLAQTIIDGADAWVIVTAEADALTLANEAIALLPEDLRWDATFSTYFLSHPPNVRCRWKFVVSGCPEIGRVRRGPGQIVIDATRKIASPDSPAASAGRTGQLIAKPRAATRPNFAPNFKTKDEQNRFPQPDDEQFDVKRPPGSAFGRASSEPVEDNLQLLPPELTRDALKGHKRGQVDYPPPPQRRASIHWAIWALVAVAVIVVSVCIYTLVNEASLRRDLTGNDAARGQADDLSSLPTNPNENAANKDTGEETTANATDNNPLPLGSERNEPLEVDAKDVATAGSETDESKASQLLKQISGFPSLTNLDTDTLRDFVENSKALTAEDIEKLDRAMLEHFKNLPPFLTTGSTWGEISEIEHLERIVSPMLRDEERDKIERAIEVMSRDQFPETMDFIEAEKNSLFEPQKRAWTISLCGTERSREFTALTSNPYALIRESLVVVYGDAIATNDFDSLPCDLDNSTSTLTVDLTNEIDRYFGWRLHDSTIIPIFRLSSDTPFQFNGGIASDIRIESSINLVEARVAFQDSGALDASLFEIEPDRRGGASTEFNLPIVSRSECEALLTLLFTDLAKENEALRVQLAHTGVVLELLCAERCRLNRDETHAFQISRRRGGGEGILSGGPVLPEGGAREWCEVVGIAGTRDHKVKLRLSGADDKGDAVTKIMKALMRDWLTRFEAKIDRKFKADSTDYTLAIYQNSEGQGGNGAPPSISTEEQKAKRRMEITRAYRSFIESEMKIAVEVVASLKPFTSEASGFKETLEKAMNDYLSNSLSEPTLPQAFIESLSDFLNSANLWKPADRRLDILVRFDGSNDWVVVDSRTED